jgi:UDP-glucose 4-epimerase
LCTKFIHRVSTNSAVVDNSPIDRVDGTLRVLVTGGAGFLGSHVVDALVARGDQVVVVDDLSTGERANVNPESDLRVADVSDSPALTRALAGKSVDAVVHAAAKTKVVESMEKKELYERVIIEGTRNVLEVARAGGAKTFVNISTGGAIYGETPVCATEDVAVDPQSNYGRFKAKAEKLVESSRLPATSLRLANIYGPRQRKDLEGGVIAIFIGCWKRREPITVYGDGRYERDYVYIADVVEAILTALDGKHAGTYNIGTGIGTSVNALVSALSALLGPPPGIKKAPPRPAEVLRGCVDPAKAARDRLWRPKTTLAEGLRLTALAEEALDRPA